ncbi:MAG TPA: diaminopimelate decarboxylase [Solirubrobacteraceae bacterium]|nr:diaminopimelate decarboxylase [Solirubrobacteraceae bacterium]
MSVAATEFLHVYPRGTRVNERGHLEIGGCDALELVSEFGSPAYVAAEEDLRARARSFVEALAARHRDGEVLFGSKAFPCTAVLRVLAEEGLGCDVASGGELHLALRGGFDPKRIYLHGNAKSESELRTAVLEGVGHVVLDSFDDLTRLDRLVEELGARQAVLIRVTPGVAPDTHHAISTGQADSKFGFSTLEAERAIEAVTASDRLELAGLHCHIGSQLFALEPFAEAVRVLAEVDDSLPTYNLGGGLGVPYTSAHQAPSVVDYVDTVVEAAHRSLGADKRLVLEPGRALVAQSTVTLYTVQTVKRNVSTWVAVDGGMSDNLRPMLYGAPYEALIANRPLSPGTERCHLVGKHCESGDVLIRDLDLPDPVPGDVVATPVTGAYGYALANNYNSVPRPPVIFCRGGTPRMVVRRETHDDLTNRDLD